ncbi:MAG: hypothetical protein WCE48_02115 [Steroidobacteraceae bacterium]
MITWKLALSTGVAALLLSLGATSPAVAQAASAAPAEDHAALALSYTREAAELKQKSDEHRNQAKLHRTTVGKSDAAHQSMAIHCNRLADSLAAAAKESEKLAALHTKLANAAH